MSDKASEGLGTRRGLMAFDVITEPLDAPTEPRIATTSTGFGVVAGAVREAAEQPGWEVDEPVDWSLVRILTRSVSEQVQTVKSDRAASGNPLSDKDVRVMSDPIVHEVVQARASAGRRDGEVWGAAKVAQHVRAVTDSLFGMGRLQPLFEIESAENININGYDSVTVVHTSGEVTQLSPVAESNAELVEQLVQIGQNAHPKRPFDSVHPEMTVMIGNMFRIHAILDETSPVPSVSIRCHHLTAVSLADLVDTGLMPMEVATLLDAAVKARLTIVVGGEIGAGKTTLLRALIDAIPKHQRFATLETDLELFAHTLPERGHNLVLTRRAGMGERTKSGDQIGEISVAQQIPWALRQDVRRIVVGEVLGGEAAAMFQAMQIGAGAMCTIHARAADAMSGRMASLVAQGTVYSHEEALREVASNVDLFVHVKLLDGVPRRRFISQISWCTPGGRDGMPVLGTVYKAAPDGSPGEVRPPSELTEIVSPYVSAALHRYRDQDAV